MGPIPIGLSAAADLICAAKAAEGSSPRTVEWYRMILIRAARRFGDAASRRDSSQGERFEMLEDTLQMARGMWLGERGSEEDFRGRKFHATRLLNVPQSISRPRVPILIGGGGEKKTLRLVAQYADASNMFGGPEQLLPKYAILAEHCAAVGRDFTEIERTNLQPVSLSRQNAWGSEPESTDQIVERFGGLAEAGVQHVIISTADAHDPGAIELLGRDVLPQLRGVEAADPRTVSSGARR